MEILGELAESGKIYNALNDINPNGGHVMHITADTYFLFEWDNEVKMWIYTPMKMYPHTTMYVTNEELLVAVRFSEKAGYRFQTTPTDMRNAEFASKVLKIFEDMKRTPPPASAKKLKKIRKANVVKRVR